MKERSCPCGSDEAAISSTAGGCDVITVSVHEEDMSWLLPLQAVRADVPRTFLTSSISTYAASLAEHLRKDT